MPIDLLAQSVALCCPNALRPQKQSIHSFRLWKPRPNGASGCSSAERYFRADMQIRPYRLHKLNGAERLNFCNDDTFSTVPFIHFVYGNQDQMAQAVAVVLNGTLGRICKSAPTVCLNSMAQSG